MPSIALSNLATFLKHGANSCNMIWEEYVTLFCQISLIAEADVVFYAGKKNKECSNNQKLLEPLLLLVP